MKKKTVVSIKTIADYHLEDYMRCSYQFYYRHLLGQESSYPSWRHMAQYTVNQVIREFYQCPVEGRSSIQILESIHRYWVKRVDLFQSRVHYLTVLGEITSHLLHHLLKDKHIEPPLFLLEKFRTEIKELEIDLSMTFQVAAWSGDGFILKKYVLDANAEFYVSYHYMATLFCKKAFRTLPERVDIVNLMTGEERQYCPTEESVGEALTYFHLAKDILEDTESYMRPKSFSDCSMCPFKKKCHRDWVPQDRDVRDYLYE